MNRIDTDTDTDASALVLRVTDESLEALVRQAAVPVLVGAYTPRCHICGDMTAAFSRLAWSFTGLVQFCLLDVEASPGAAFQLGIRRTPSVVLVHEGVLSGFAKSQNEAGMRALLDIRTECTSLRPQTALLAVTSSVNDVRRLTLNFDASAATNLRRPLLV